MTRAEKIRTMTDKELAIFIFKYSVEQTVGFLQNGGAGCMNLPEVRDWLGGEHDPEADKVMNEKPIGEEG